MTCWIPLRQLHLIRWCTLILLAAPITSAMAAGTQASAPEGTKSSAMTIHVPIPVTPLAELYGNVNQQLAAHRTRGREWVTLGGGSGFLKYRLWPDEQGSTTAGDRLLSQHRAIRRGIRQADRRIDHKNRREMRDLRDAATGTGRLSVSSGDDV
ncbi:MAG: hypothetical protein QM771_14960 [Nitrospira sp.]